MRYELEHKAKTHTRIVKDAARRFRSEGLTGASVATVMRDTGLTHGGFYKHFPSKTDLLIESIGEAFEETARWLSRVAEHAPAGSAWKAIVAAYLSLDHCDHPERGCPLSALAPELGRSEPGVRMRVSADMVNYKDQLVGYMPGRRASDRDRAFFAIFSTMIGAVEMARMMSDAGARRLILNTARNFLFDAFSRKALAAESETQG
jgi:TetR/AcrR family transcriptional repressor of nem operon